MIVRFQRPLAVMTALLIIMAQSLVALAHPGQHGVNEGHLLGTGAWGNISFVSKLIVPDAEEGLIADLTVFDNYAYLARWGGADCPGPEGNGPDGGVYIIDISNLSQPRQVGFIRTHQDTLVGEGMQVVRVSTSKFSGDILAVNHEQCGKNGKAGFSLWNVTNPLDPRKLSENFGDLTTPAGKNRPRDANQYHSVFVWNAGDRAYLVATDDDETNDVDIFDITDPRKPVQIADVSLNQYNISQPEYTLTQSFLHDMVVKRIGNQWVMLLSYWDGGYVLLNVDNPANPIFLGDSDYAAVDPELLAQTGSLLTPEGNGHQAEFTLDNRFVIATDEDFDPYRLEVAIAGGDYIAKPGSNTTIDEGQAITGLPIFVGRACPGDPAVPPAPSSPGPQLAVVERGLCLFTEKVASVLAAGGYEAVVIINREGADACVDVFAPTIEGAIPTIFIGRNAGFALFDLPFDLTACFDDNPLPAPIAIGTVGRPITNIVKRFDGWGYVHLFGVTLTGQSATLTDLDTFAIPEAMQPSKAAGFGDLSVHEVATDLRNPMAAYLSYYSGGLRSIQIVCPNPSTTVGCRLVEVGGYLDPNGNNFWGVDTIVRNGQTYVLASDRDSGLWIFKAT